MFANAKAFNQPLSGWDVSNVTNMSNMFYTFNPPEAPFNQDIGSWNVDSVTTYTNFMLGRTASTFSASYLDSIYNGWIANPLSPAESISFGSIKYTTTGSEGRALLTRTNATVAVSNAADNGSGLIRITTGTAHGLSTGNKIFIQNVGGTTEANGLWAVTVVDTTNIDLDGSTFTNGYTTGGTVRTGYGWTITDGGLV